MIEKEIHIPKIDQKRRGSKNLFLAKLDLLQITSYVHGTTELPSVHRISWSSSESLVQKDLQELINDNALVTLEFNYKHTAKPNERRVR